MNHGNHHFPFHDAQLFPSVPFLYGTASVSPSIYGTGFPLSYPTQPYAPNPYAYPSAYPSASNYMMPPAGYAPPATPAPAAAKTATVFVYDNRFAPERLEVAPGTAIQWVSYAGHAHTVTATNGQFDGELQPGETYTVTLSMPGTYYYQCRFHKGMSGTIVVGKGSY